MLGRLWIWCRRFKSGHPPFVSHCEITTYNGLFFSHFVTCSCNPFCNPKVGRQAVISVPPNLNGKGQQYEEGRRRKQPPPPTPTSNLADVDSVHSSRREKLVEHLFVGEVLRKLWCWGVYDVDVLRAETDAAGYDIVIEVASVVRHIQLKSSALARRLQSKRSISLSVKSSVVASYGLSSILQI